MTALKTGFLSIYVTEAEFLHSDDAIKHNIKNVWASPDHKQNAITLCTKFIDIIRAHYGRPVIITSGYRCTLLNKEVGGAVHPDGTPKSLHCLGNAADFHVQGITLKQVFNDIVTGVIKFEKPWEEIIWEFGGEWIHLGRALTCHKEIMESYYITVGTKKRTVYKNITKVQ